MSSAWRGSIAEEPGSDIDDPGAVDHAGEGQEAAGRVGEAADRAGRVGSRMVADAKAVPLVPKLMTSSSAVAPMPSAAAMLSPVPGPTGMPVGRPSAVRRLGGQVAGDLICAADSRDLEGFGSICTDREGEQVPAYLTRRR